MFCMRLSRQLVAKSSSSSCWKNVSSVVAHNNAYVKVSGLECKKFLQGICTVDTGRLSTENPCVSGVFLTPKGRIMADAIFYEVKSTEEPSVPTIIIETAKSSIDALFHQLKLYRMRSKIGLEVLSGMSTVVTRANPSCSQGNSVFPTESVVCQVKDPRTNGEFVDRLLINLSVEQVAEFATNSKQSANFLTSVDALDWYTNARLLCGISEGEECVGKIPLEFNFDLLHSIDFNKGCYVGQELTARTKHQGLVRKRVLPFVLDESLLCKRSGTGGDNASFARLSTSAMEALLKTGYKASEGGKSILSAGCTIYARKPDGEKPAKVGEVLKTNANQSAGICIFRVGHLLDAANQYVAEIEDSASGSTTLVPLFPYRPQWWPDVDPVTRKPVISNM